MCSSKNVEPPVGPNEPVKRFWDCYFRFLFLKITAHFVIIVAHEEHEP